MRKYVFIMVISFLSCLAYGQIATNEQPYGLRENSRAVKQNSIVLPSPNRVSIDAEDSANDCQSCGLRYAYPVHVNYTLENSGQWQQLADGGRLWRLKVSIPDALSTNTYYDTFYIPKGCKFFVYSEDTKQSIGAITSEFLNSSRANPIRFATALIYGENVVYEYYQPASVKEAPLIHISRIDYGYRYVRNPYAGQQRGNEPGFDASGKCNIDINCPDGDDWQEEKRAVARISTVKPDGSSWCSGALINNTNEDYTPYFLSAYHCARYITNDSYFSQWVFYWDYEHYSCGGSIEPVHKTTTGAMWIAEDSYTASNVTLDFLLIKLTQDPRYLTGYSPYYLGWDRSGNPGKGGVGIHHPSADVKKISTYTMTPEIGSLKEWWGVRWDKDKGIIEGGSSGSPLLNSEHRIIGQLKSAPSTYSCDNPVGVCNYPKFSMSWDGNPTDPNLRPSYRLRDWLDPTGTGAVTLDGTDIWTWECQPLDPNIPLIKNKYTAGNPVWASNVNIQGTITVTSGSTLTIKNAKISFTPTSSIFVRAGGRLVLDNCTLTNACDGELWKGIVVTGNDYSTQPVLSQGLVELKNGAIIENAICGIKVETSYSYDSKIGNNVLATGSVYADNAQFINNQQALFFRNDWCGYSPSTHLANNKSTFNGCKFILNDNNLLQEKTGSQVHVSGNDNVSFTNCTFADNCTKNSAGDYTTGIYADGSKIMVGNYSLPPHSGCSFSGFDMAICLSGHNASKIYASTFTNNHIAIGVYAVQDVTVEKCQFEISTPSHFTENIGIYLKNSSLYKITNNYFEGGTADKTIGIVTQNTGTSNHFIRNNTFKYLCMGCQSIGQNADAQQNDKSQGLVYQCNRFEENNKDISIDVGSRIRFLQSGKRILHATGNVFDNSNWNIDNEGSTIKYQYLSNQPLHNPILIPANQLNSAISVEPKDGHCCVSYGYSGDYYYTIDCDYSFPNGNIEGLNTVYHTSENLSDTWDTEYKQKFGIMPINWIDAMVQAIIAQLKMSVGNPFVITVNGMPPSNDLEEQIVLFYEISNLKQQMDRICYAALELLANDTAGLDLSEYRLWISRFNTVESDYALADSYINFGEFADAGNILSAMPLKFPYLDMGTHQNYLDYVVAAQTIDSLLHEDYTLSPSFIGNVITYFKVNNLLPPFLVDDLMNCFETQIPISSDVRETLTDIFKNKTDFFPFWRQKATQYLTVTATLTDNVINELFDNFVYTPVVSRYIIEDKNLYPYWQDGFVQYLEAQGLQSTEIDNIIVYYQTMPFPPLFVDTLVGYFNANLPSDYWKNVLYNYVSATKQIPVSLVNNFVISIGTGSEFPYNLMYELVSNVLPIELSPMLSSLAEMTGMGESLNFLYDNSVCIEANITASSSDFLPNLLVYAKENPTFPSILKDELFHSFGIDIIPAYLIDGLVILSSYDDFVSIRAYSLGEKLFANWTTNYPRTFAVHSSCVCSENNENPQPQNTPINNGTPPQEEQTTEKPILSIAEKGEIVVKPNPTKNQLQVTSYELQINDVEIYSVMGQKLNNYQISIVNYQLTIDVSHLANGVYYLKIQTDNGIVMKKFVKY